MKVKREEIIEDLVQAGGEETAEGIQFLIILHIRDDPEVAEGYSGTLMVLDHQGAFAMCFVGTAHFPVDPGIVMNQVSVVMHSQAHGLGQGSIGFKYGCLIQNIVRLPVTRCPAGIDEGWVLSIDRTAGTIGKGVVLKTVQYLQFISGHQKDSGISIELTLAFVLGFGGGIKTEFQVDLGIAKFLFGWVVSLTTGHRSILIKFPVWIGPLSRIQHQGIGRFFHLALSLGQWSDHGGEGACLVVTGPTGPGERPAYIASGFGLLGRTKVVHGVVDGIEIEGLCLGV